MANRFGEETGREATKTKCRECPFKKKSAAGWLGANHPRQFANAVETGIPCHMTVDYEDEGWEVEQEWTHVCKGSLELMANAGMRPIDPEISAMVEATEKNDDVFTWSFEFVRHHESAPVRSWELS